MKNTVQNKTQFTLCMDAKRIKARRLFVNQLYNQKQVARMCNVTEKTMGKWVLKFGWNELRTKFLEKRSSPLLDGPVPHEVILLDLMEYIREFDESISDVCSPIIQKYIEQLSAPF